MVSLALNSTAGMIVFLPLCEQNITETVKYYCIDQRFLTREVILIILFIKQKSWALFFSSLVE
jgi:hypothetical protein